MFHTTFNIILAIIRTPLLGVLLKVLHRMFPAHASELHLAIDSINTTLPEEVIHALEKDTKELLTRVEQYNRHVLYLDHTAHYPQKTHDDYAIIKQMEEKLLKYIITSHTFELNQEQSHQIHVLNDIIIQALTSSKDLKDIQHHIINLKDESIQHPLLADSLHFFQEMMQKTSESIHSLNNATTAESNGESLETTLTMLHANDDFYLENITTKRNATEINSVNISEVIKTNRYVLLSCDSLLKSYIDYTPYVSKY
ncbi:hypothetical protein KA478_02060 [Patescibacteria group bacterium]|nr:hypothetical protein [Patescibacteria group bacterium]